MRSSRAIATLLLCCAACGGTDDAPAATGPRLTSPSTPTTPGPVATTQPATTPSTLAPAVYTVRAGDSLFAIAEQLCVELDTIVATNAWTDGIDHPIFPGDTITVPAGACAPDASATAPTSAEPDAQQVDTARFEFCDPGECGFPYGDPSDGVMVYEAGPCTEIREALRTVAMGPTQASRFELPASENLAVAPLIDEQQVRDEAAANWQSVIDAYGGMGDVPEGVTTALGRAGAIEADLAVAYLRVIEFDAIPPAGADQAVWDGLYLPMADLMETKQANIEPIIGDLDERCAATGASA